METMPTFLTKEQLAQFQAPQCHKDIVSYIESLNASVTGMKLSDEGQQSLVSCVPSWINNKAFRATLGHRCDSVPVGSGRGARGRYSAS